MRRLLASGPLPERAGQPVKALVHIYFAELRELDQDSALQDKWIQEYRPGGAPSAPPPRSARVTAGPDWRETRPGRWSATR